ncbi:MAG: Crp/Fnr family transcriptional regulator [Candidatus Sulfotelmatobacter sp.]|jgi:CRP-like cAMP-binding protein
MAKATVLRPIGRADRVDGQEVRNELLLHLPENERELIHAQLTFMTLSTHAILNEAEGEIEDTYFMNSGLASVLNVMKDGKSVEVGLTGKEGFVGLPVIVGFKSSPSRVIVQVSGSAFRLNTPALLKALRKCSELQRRLHRYSQVLSAQSSQVAACNRLHEVDERLARWLLMSQDRLGSSNVELTQEFLAHMLGTRRSSVTVAASILQKAGLIRYTRGHVQIVNRLGLEAAACECYEMMVKQGARWDGEIN